MLKNENNLDNLQFKNLYEIIILFLNTSKIYIVNNILGEFINGFVVLNEHKNI